jgi:hypothetical protein
MYFRVFARSIHRSSASWHASQGLRPFTSCRSNLTRSVTWSQVGLLPAGNHQQIPFAYKMFSRDDEIGWKQSNAFKKAFSMNVEVEFVGVWYAPFLT